MGWLSKAQTASLTQSVQASIEIPSMPLSYTPGDAIHGVVKRVCTVPGGDPALGDVSVHVDLIARVETEVLKSEGSGDNRRTTRYHGRRLLYHARHDVYRGPVRYGINSWPFSVVIPDDRTPPSSSAAPAGTTSSSTTAGSEAGRHLQAQLAPLTAVAPSFHRRHEPVRAVGQRRDVVFVEWRLEAHVLLPQQQDHHYHQRQQQQPQQAAAASVIGTSVFPVFVRARSTALPIPRAPNNNDPALLFRAQLAHLVKTHRLDPAVGETGRKSLRQHVQTVFRRDRLPRFAFDVVVETPRHLQLGGAAGPVCFRVGVVPCASSSSASLGPGGGGGEAETEEKTTSEFLAKNPPRVTLEGVELRLRTATHVDGLEGRNSCVTGLSEGGWDSRWLINWRKDKGGLGKGVKKERKKEKKIKKEDRKEKKKMKTKWKGKGREGNNDMGDDDDQKDDGMEEVTDEKKRHRNKEKKKRGKEKHAASSSSFHQDADSSSSSSDSDSDSDSSSSSSSSSSSDSEDHLSEDPTAILLLPSSSPSSPSSAHPLLDIGALLNLVLTPTGTLTHNNVPHTTFSQAVYPTFRSRHATHVHELKWRVAVRCAGKTLKTEGKCPVEVLGPSDDAERWREARCAEVAAAGGGSAAAGEQAVVDAHRLWTEGRLPMPTLVPVPAGETAAPGGGGGGGSGVGGGGGSGVTESPAAGEAAELGPGGDGRGFSKAEEAMASTASSTSHAAGGSSSSAAAPAYNPPPPASGAGYASGLPDEEQLPAYEETAPDYRTLS